MLMALLLGGALSGCSQYRFHRFMDHPITSWLPLDEYLGDDSDKLAVPAMVPGEDSRCYEIAKDRTAFNGVRMGATEVQRLFRAEYSTCLRNR